MLLLYRYTEIKSSIFRKFVENAEGRASNSNFSLNEITSFYSFLKSIDKLLLWEYDINRNGDDANMIKKIYHGSENIIEQPIFGFGKTYNDYGLGFYCTEEIDMAKEWGVNFDRDGYANIYEIETDSLNILDLNDDKYIVLHWLAILLENREFDAPSGLAAEAKEYILKNFMIDYKNYDVIIGYRADDSYFSFAQDFINGTISYRQLGNALRLGKLGQQFVLISKKAFDSVKFVGYEVAMSKEWFNKKDLRDKTARREYFDVERNKRQRGDIYIAQIIDEEMKADDSRLR